MRLSIFLKHDLTKKYVRTKLKPKTQVRHLSVSDDDDGLTK